MDLSRIIRATDHTLLATTATWPQIAAVCDEGAAAGAASVCLPPCFVQRAAAYLGSRLPVCTVIGFPHGTSTAASKCFEAAEAVQNGAAEVDMVIHVGTVKEGRLDDVEAEIAAVKAACDGRLLKVIVETCLLTDDEKRALCGVVAAAGADYIKTSTGYSTGGATLADIRLMRAASPASLKIKAAGGIRSLDDAVALLDAGADRLGSSSLLRLCAEAARA